MRLKLKKTVCWWWTCAAVVLKRALPRGTSPARCGSDSSGASNVTVTHAPNSTKKINLTRTQ